MASSDPRVSVIGISGSGKTTFAERLAGRLHAPLHELDLINWRPGWYDRYVREFDAFRADVEAAAAGDTWVFSGGYSKVRPLIWGRATHVVWLDLPFPVVLRQVVGRSWSRAIDRTPILNGNTESFSRWIDKGHPIQLVVRNFNRKRAQFEAMVADPAYAHLQVFRCRSHAEAEAAAARFTALAATPQAALSMDPVSA